ncbi:MAG: hypothetical protein NTV51_07505 [Verrucomicrobia bacterium]|nr:hypothetical protein [Verrucomicrobiota bacterium]
MLSETIDSPASGAVGLEAKDPSSRPGPAAGRVVVGACWNGRYQVSGVWGDATTGWYQATDLTTGEGVLLRTFAAADDVKGRTARFERLRAIPCPHWQRPIESHLTADGLVQVWEGVAGVSLRRWRADQSEPTAEVTAELVRQLALAVEALHAAGLGHFQLNADWIFVREEPAGPHFVVGGLDRVTETEQKGLIMIEADPLYAPPETAGLFKHSPGSALLAWDWWSVGRVVQQFMIGRHVVTLVPPDLRAGLPQSLGGLAEALLFERATGTLRAGAVELMGALEPRLARLLRGLLTSSMDGRWGAESVRSWLAGELPVERYNSARLERFFRIDGRSHSAAEAADRLLGPEHCARVEEHALAANQAGTLAKFLAESETHRRDWAQIESVRALEKSTALTKVEPKLRHLVVATLALNSLAQGHFRWKGKALNPENLRAALDRPEEFATLRTELIVLSEPALVAQVRRYDHTAADLLEELVKWVLDAELFFEKQVGVKPADLGDPAALWRLALTGETELTATRLKMKTRYAMTTDAAVERVFSVPHPTPVMILVLARMEQEAPRFGFLTHEEVRQRRLAELLKRAAALVKIVFWGRLELAMKAGPMVFGRRWLFAAAGIGGILLLAVHVPGPTGVLLGLTPIVLALGLRLLTNREQAVSVGRWIAETTPWAWRDGIGRCETELRRLAIATGQPTTLAAATAELKRICAEVKTVAIPADEVRLNFPPRQAATWAAVAAGWVLGVLLAVGSVRQGIRHPPSLAMHLTAWRQIVSPPHAPTAEELRNAKLKWPYRRSLIEEPFEITVQGQFHPTPEQLHYAEARARQQLANYIPETIDTLVAIYVPVDDTHGALMLFDGRKNAMQGNNGVLINYLPFAKQWIGIGDQRALFIER